MDEVAAVGVWSWRSSQQWLLFRLVHSLILLSFLASAGGYFFCGFYSLSIAKARGKRWRIDDNVCASPCTFLKGLLVARANIVGKFYLIHIGE